MNVSNQPGVEPTLPDVDKLICRVTSHKRQCTPGVASATAAHVLRPTFDSTQEP